MTESTDSDADTGRHESAAGAGWRRVAHRLGLQGERIFSTVRDRFDARFRPDRPVQIVGYRGFSNDTHATLSARVLHYSTPPDDDPVTVWDHLQASYRRFETDEIVGERVVLETGPDARLDAGPDAHADRYEALSDEEGYVHFGFPPPVGSDAPSFDVTLRLPDRPGSIAQTVQVLRPPADAGFGIISDVDDTVLVTDATSLLKMMRLTLLESSASRVAFPGVAAFYRALEAQGRRPFFYVSSSPWNLYDFLDDFMRLKDLPSGPLLLRDLGIDDTKFIAGEHRAHKLDAIRSVITRYPALEFVLIGDSGQHDPEIYTEIVREFPGRIRSIYIRDVSHDVRDREVLGLIEELNELDVEMLMVPDTLAAARHAATRGLIDVEALARVRRNVEDDRMPHEAMDLQEG